MKKITARLLTGFFALLLLANVSSHALAQEEDDTEFFLEEITVTAQKRSENQQKVAVAMDVITSDNINEMGKNDIDEVLSSIPGVIINKASDGLRVSIRGMANDMNEKEGRHFSSVSVAVNTDGVSSNITNSSGGLYDIERVEVLYGPQSTLYASTSPGGIVNVVTANPKMDTYEGNGTFEIGNYNLLHTAGSVNAPVSDTIAFRAAFSTTTRDGYLSNGSDDEDTKSGRIKALYTPTDKLSILLATELSRIDGKGFSGVTAFVDQDDQDDPWETDDETGSPRYENMDKYYGKADLDLDFATLTIIPSYSKLESSSSTTSTDNDGASTESVDEGETEEKSLEARMASNENDKMKWVAGYIWYETEDTMHASTYTEDVLSEWRDMQSEQEISALYGNLTYSLAETARLTAGIRYNWDRTWSYSLGYPDNRGEGAQETELEYHKANYKLGFEYDLSESSMLYSDWSTSYRARAQFDSDGNPFPAEEMAAYTIGAKNRFFDNKFQLNVSGFYYDYENYLATTNVSTIYDENGNGIMDADETETTQDENAKQVGDARVYGVDLQTTTVLSSKDRFDFSVSYLKKYFTHLYFDFYEITNSLGVDDLDYSGKDMPFAPRWSISASFSHDFSLPNGGILTATLDSRYQSSYKIYFLDTVLNIESDGSVTELEVADIAYQEAHHISNAALVYAHPEGKWTLTGYVKNLENYAVKRNLELMGGVTNFRVGSPRTYGAILSVKF
jgi:iron complex outermembrane receptor protein